MYKILKAEKLADMIYLMDVEAPRVARHCMPGQFVIVKMDEKGERIPLTICDYDREAGTITIVFQTVGASTHKMAELKAGDSFRDFTGPLGCPSELVEEDLETLKKKKILSIIICLCHFMSTIVRKGANIFQHTLRVKFSRIPPFIHKLSLYRIQFYSHRNVDNFVSKKR